MHDTPSSIDLFLELYTYLSLGYGQGVFTSEWQPLSEILFFGLSNSLSLYMITEKE